MRCKSLCHNASMGFDSPRLHSTRSKNLRFFLACSWQAIILKTTQDDASNGALSERSESKGMAERYYVYILLCADKSFYVGSTKDIKTRIKRHNDGQGAQYTRIRRPVRLVYHEVYPDEVAAVRRERHLKRWSRAKKLALIEGNKDRLKQLSKRRN